MLRSGQNYRHKHRNSMNISPTYGKYSTTPAFPPIKTRDFWLFPQLARLLHCCGHLASATRNNASGALRWQKKTGNFR
jgi:hypothetical protein